MDINNHPPQKYPNGSMVYILFFSQIRYGIIQSAQVKFKDHSFGWHYTIKNGKGKQSSLINAWEWDIAAHPMELMERYIDYCEKECQELNTQ